MTTDVITRSINKAKFSVNKHSPEILLVVGIVGVVTSAVMACKATRKIDAVIDKHNDSVKKIKEVAETAQTDDGVTEYSENDTNKALAITYATTAVDFAKLYGPSVLVGTSSLVCILASNNIMRKRNAALGAAYTTVFNSFREYRKRVTEKYGPEIEKQLRYGIKSEEVKTTVVNEKGKEKEKTETVMTFDPNGISDYARVFGEGYTSAWDKDVEYNMVFLKAQQAIATNKLRRDGFLFLNDVYDMLGFDRTKYGQIVGWRYDEKNPTGDNFVDFGLYNLSIPENINFMNGTSNMVLLDFNVDGDILSSM